MVSALWRHFGVGGMHGRRKLSGEGASLSASLDGVSVSAPAITWRHENLMRVIQEYFAVTVLHLVRKGRKSTVERNLLSASPRRQVPNSITWWCPEAETQRGSSGYRAGAFRPGVFEEGGDMALSLVTADALCRESGGGASLIGSIVEPAKVSGRR
jgi:hypothetical protein